MCKYSWWYTTAGSSLSPGIRSEVTIRELQRPNNVTESTKEFNHRTCSVQWPEALICTGFRKSERTKDVKYIYAI